MSYRIAAEAPELAAAIASVAGETSAEVELWKLTGAGHGWPGAVTGREKLIGPETGVIDVAEEVWRFVSRFQKE